jgi:hypothetical protein
MEGVEQIAYYHNRVSGESKWDSPGLFRGVNAVEAALTMQNLAKGSQHPSAASSPSAASPSASSPAAKVAAEVSSNQLDDKRMSDQPGDGGVIKVAQQPIAVVSDPRTGVEDVNNALVKQPETVVVQQPTEYTPEQGQQNDPYVLEQMEKAKNKDMEDANNPNLLPVRVQFAGKIEDGVLIKNSEEIGFRFYVPKVDGAKVGTNIAELLEEISEAFGYSLEQLRLFYDGKLCQKSASVFSTIGLSYLDPVESASLSTPIFVLYTNGDADHNPEHIFKPVDHSAHAEKVVFEPQSTNWMGQYIILHQQLQISSTPKVKAASSGFTKDKGQSFEELKPQLMIEKEMYDLHTRFFEAAKQEAEVMAAQCHRQLNDAGVPGAWWRHPNSTRKQTKNNIELMELRDWFTFHNKWEKRGGKDDSAAILDAAGKMANHELRGMQLARDLVDGLYTPLCAIIDVAGVHFLATAVYSGGPQDVCTLAYGSDEFGLHIKDAAGDEACLEKVAKLADKLNLRAHKIKSPIDTSTVIELSLPMGARIYKLVSKEALGEPIYFLSGGMHLCPRAVNVEGRSYNPWQRVRSEYATNFGVSQELAEGWEYHTSIEPKMCSESNTIITDYQYYTFVATGTKKKAYNCSLKEYKDRVYTNNFNGVRRTDLKLVTVPVKHREEYWENNQTGEKVYRKPINRTPLNHDWLEHNDPKAKAEMSTLANLLESEAPEPEHDDDPEVTKELSVLDHLVEDLKEIFEDENYLTEDGRELPVAEVFEEEFTPNTGEELVTEMHKRGLSLYHLGAVLSRLSTGEKYKHLRQMCTKEIIARSVKALVRAELRSGTPKTRKGPQPADEEAEYGGDKFTSQIYLRQVMRYYLNLVFQPADARTDASQVLWRKLKSYSHRHFGFEVKHADLAGMYKETVLHACCKQLRIRLSGIPALDNGLVVRHLADSKRPDLQRRLDTPDGLLLEDIEEVLPMSRCVVYEGATVSQLMRRGQAVDAKGSRTQWPQIGGPERGEATDTLRQAVQAACIVYGGESKQASEARFLLAEQLKSRHSEKGRPELSRWNRCGQIMEDDFSIEARGYFKVNKLLLLQEGMSMRLAQCCLGLAQLSKDSLNHSDNSNHITHSDRIKNGPPQCECAQFLNEASVVTEALLGTNHPASARLYMNWAGAYQDLASYDDASTWLRHAFIVHEGMYGLHHPATMECWRHLKTVEVKVHDGLQDTPLENVKAEIEEREQESSDSDYDDDGTEYDDNEESDEDTYHN